jgi:hypothetical protein
MTFLERYEVEKTWHGRATVMGLYHLAQGLRFGKWTVTQTAQYFNCSIGLVSENIKLAKAISEGDKLIKCESRQEALKRLNSH